MLNSLYIYIYISETNDSTIIEIIFDFMRFHLFLHFLLFPQFLQFFWVLILIFNFIYPFYFKLQATLEYFHFYFLMNYHFI